MKKLIISLTISLLFMPLKGYTQTSISTLKQELKKGDTTSERLITISKFYSRKERNSDSIFKYSKLLKNLAEQNSDSLLFGETYLMFANAHFLESSYDSVFYYGKQAIKLFNNYDKKGSKANAEILLGNTHQSLFENKAALDYLRQALPYAEEVDQIAVQIGLANVYTQLNNLEKASFHFNEAFIISKELNNDFYLYNIHNGLAVVYLKGEKKEEVLNSLLKALDIALKQDNYIGQAKCLHNIGHYYNGTKEYSMAISHFKRAIILFPKINSKFLKASVYRLYAESLTELSNIVDANYYLDKAEVIYTNRIPTRLGLIKLSRANIAIKNNQPKEAIKSLEEGILISKKNKLMANLSASYLMLSEIKEALGNSQGALNAFKNHKIYRDSVSQRNKTKEIEALKLQFDIAQYEQEILVKDQKLALLDSEKVAGQYRNILLAVIMIGLLFFVYRQRKINNINKVAFKAEKELNLLKQAQIQQGKREITEYAIHINEHNKLLDTCLTQIKGLKRKAHDAVIKSGLTNLQIYISDNMDINKEKIALDTKVESEQQAFIFNLKQKFPNLSQKEIQVATYLVLNLASKQIANQMRIKEQSVYNYRLSLRKKLGIKKEDNLNEALRNI